ncbi:unnamed protein product, partial [marine sediment metagenome]
MLINDILKQVYSSHSATVYRLEDPEMVETSLAALIEKNGRSKNILVDVNVSDTESMEFNAIE